MDREQQKERARERRNNKFRIRKRVREYYKQAHGYNEREYEYDPVHCIYPDRAVGTKVEALKLLLDHEAQTSETPHPCSRCCCGNPRKHWNARTRAELLATFDAEDQLEESGVSLAQAKRLYQRILRRRLSW